MPGRARGRLPARGGAQGAARPAARAGPLAGGARRAAGTPAPAAPPLERRGPRGRRRPGGPDRVPGVGAHPGLPGRHRPHETAVRGARVRSGRARAGGARHQRSRGRSGVAARRPACRHRWGARPCGPAGGCRAGIPGVGPVAGARGPDAATVHRAGDARRLFGALRPRKEDVPMKARKILMVLAVLATWPLTGQAQEREERQRARTYVGPRMFSFNFNRARIGVVPKAGVDAAADRVGAGIEAVTPGGPAEKAGLKAGDVITRFNGVSLAKNDDHDSNPSAKLVRLAQALDPGDTVRIEYRRGAENRTATLVAEEVENRWDVATTIPR